MESADLLAKKAMELGPIERIRLVEPFYTASTSQIQISKRVGSPRLKHDMRHINGGSLRQSIGMKSERGTSVEGSVDIPR